MDHSEHDESLIQRVEEEVVAESGSAIFGAFDGVTAVLGVLVSLLGQREAVLTRACIGLAISSAIGMAFGAYSGDKERRVAPALVIGVATAFGTLLPVVGFFFLPKAPAVVLAAVLTALLGVAIAHNRAKTCSRVLAYGQTFALLGLAAAANIAFAVLTPGGAG